MGVRENAYQNALIKTLNQMFPGCWIIKQDSGYMQGIPDLLVLHRDKWAMLEVKASDRSAAQPNQEYYIGKAAYMSFGAFIYPENEEEVLRDLQQTFESGR